MKVAVTGASGHIGGCLIRELIKKGFQVRVLVRRSKQALQDLPLELVEGDLLDIASLYELCKEVDVVFHLAAQIAIDRKEEKQVLETNIKGTENLLEVSRKLQIPRFIHFSSIHALDVHPLDKVMDESRNLISETNRVYELSKVESERSVLAAAAGGLNALILNPTAVIGPFDYHQSYLGQALVRIYNNKLPVLVVGGYNWVDVRDVVQATLASVTQGRKGERYILSGHWSSLKQLSEMIAEISGKRTPRLVAPLLVAHVGLPFIRLFSKLKGEHPLYTKDSLDILKESHQNISNQKARIELGFNPRPLAVSLADTFEWYKQQGLLL
jgi:dihydroflavonol-4-reductase